MAYQQSDLERIRACITSGVLETRFADGRSVRYQNLDAMIAAEKRIMSSLASGGGQRRRSTPVYRNGC